MSFRILLCWQPNISDAGVAALASCERLEEVDLMGTATGDRAAQGPSTPDFPGLWRKPL